MPYWKTCYHLVWATKDRHPWLEPRVEPALFAYLVDKCAEIGVYVYAINGWIDHIHLVAAIPPHLSVAEVVKRLKGSSSYDLKRSGLLDPAFAWQGGYGALTLGERQRKDAEAYVNLQKTHHQQQTANTWLERFSEADEGPQVQGLQPGSTIGEEIEEYEFLGEAPF
jgi:putative transposase